MTLLSKHLRAALLLLTKSGDITPQGVRIIEKILDQHEAPTGD